MSPSNGGDFFMFNKEKKKGTLIKCVFNVETVDITVDNITLKSDVYVWEV